MQFISSEQAARILELLTSIRQKITDIAESIERVETSINDIEDAIKNSVIYPKSSDN
jgi:methyl-accepting chemotaxis protein